MAPTTFKKILYVTGVLLAFAIFVIYLTRGIIQRSEALQVERMWRDRVSKELPIGATKEDAESQIRSYGLSPLWHEEIKESTAFIGYNAKYLFQDYSLKIIVKFDQRNRVIDAEVVRSYSTFM